MANYCRAVTKSLRGTRIIITKLVSSFNLSQSFNYVPYLFSKNGPNQRSIVSVYGPRKGAKTTRNMNAPQRGIAKNTCA
jgi:predicted AAA+ superfamily ATPase